MVEMLNLINKTVGMGHTLTDAQNKIIADYISGKTDYKKVAAIFPANRTYYLDGKEISKISMLVGKDKSLLPCLARFMDVIVPLIHDWCVTDAYEKITAHVPFEELYGGGAAIIGTIVEKIFFVLRRSYRTSVLDKVFGGWSAFLQRLVEKYGDEIVKEFPHFSEPAKIFTAVLFYNIDPVKYSKFADAIIECGVKLFAQSLPANAFELIDGEPFFSGNEYVRKAEKSYKLLSLKGILSKPVINQSAVTAFYTAFFANDDSFSESSPANNPTDVINYLYVLSELKSAEKSRPVIDIFTDDSALFAKAGRIPKETHFISCIGAVSNNIELKQRLDFIHDNEAAAMRALKHCEYSFTKAMLLYGFWKDGKYLEKVYEVEKLLVADVTDNAELADWFLHGDGAVSALSKDDLSVNLWGRFKNTLVIPALLGFSDAAKRVVEYLIYNKADAQITAVLCALTALAEYSEAKELLNGAGVSATEIVVLLAGMYEDNSYYSRNEKRDEFIQKYITEYFAENNDVDKIFPLVGANGKSSLLKLQYEAVPDYPADFALRCLGESAKTVRETAIIILQKRPDLIDKVTELLTHKKKTFRESAQRLVNIYNNVTETADGAGVDERSNGEFNLLEFTAKNLPSTAGSSLKWAGFENLPKVRLANSENFADESALKCYLYIYMSSAVNVKTGSDFRAVFNRDDIRDFAKAVYAVWKNDNAPAKRKQVLTFAAVNADDAFINRIFSDLKAWADASRGALAAEAIKAIAKNGSDISLMLVDSVSKKFPNRQVKRAAEEAFAAAANDLGLAPEVLADRIIPDLGFDSRGERVFDYGTRKFIARLSGSLTIELRTEDDKPVKSLPAASSKDDEQKVKAVKAELAFVKKQLKNVVGIQSFRLEQALSDCRVWLKSDWEKIFVKNPVMTGFAVGLIWGVYGADGALARTFRYLEDGTFTDVDENDIKLPDDTKIGLCHPLDIGAELTEKWTSQLADYDIVQPVEQLARRVFKLPAGDRTAADKKITALNLSDKTVLAITLLTKLQKFGWRKGAVEDGGMYCRFYKEDGALGIGVCLSFEGAYAGGGDMDDTTALEEVCFYKISDAAFAHDGYFTVPENKRIDFTVLPARFYSEVMYDLTRTVGEFDV